MPGLEKKQAGLFKHSTDPVVMSPDLERAVMVSDPDVLNTREAAAFLRAHVETVRRFAKLAETDQLERTIRMVLEEKTTSFLRIGVSP